MSDPYGGFDGDASALATDTPAPLASIEDPTCDGIPTEIGVWFAEASRDPSAELRVGTITVAEVAGCFAEGTVFNWTASNGVLGNTGQRLNWTPDLAGLASLEVCATAPGGVPVCITDDVDVAFSNARVSIDTVTTSLDIGFGRFLVVEGHVEQADPASVRLELFKHTDVSYIDGTVPVAADGSFVAYPFVMSNVDRIHVAAVAPSTDISQQTLCNPWFCFGAVDEISGRHLPLIVDGSDVYDVDVHYFIRADHPDPTVASLLDRFTPAPISGTVDGHLVSVDAERPIYFTYDQAAAAIGLISAGEPELAESILDAMAQTQLVDGSWPFLMHSNGDAYWGEGGKRYAGAVAWMLMAYNAYHIATETTTYMPVVTAGLDFLQTERFANAGHFPVRFNPYNLPETNWDENEVFSFEHNADVLSAFAGHAQVLGYESHPGTLADLTAWLEERWNGRYFNPGTHTFYGDSVRERYLDTQTWGLLALGGSATQFHPGLRNDCQVFLEVAGHIDEMTSVIGMSDFAWSTGELPHGPFVWTEGTLGYAAALDEIERKTGTTLLCNGFDSDDFIDSMQQLLLGTDMSMATRNAHPGYTEVPGTAALSWWLMVDAGVNPFRPWETL